ncbi:MAG TPA: serine hydrolase domain-containing protein [Steroidobacteraceae bacterium]|jgi:CubicO group peptidase (beta-lactamase class C family)|nr:serine hydrolase domain-containing protein [Steroidobacteraceae bacterium]
MHFIRTALLVFASGWLAACGGDGDAVAPPAAAIPDPFIAVDRAASAAFAAQGISGMGLSIYDANGVKRFERMYGTFSADQRVAIASASKMVAGLTIFRLIDQGFLTLDSTTAAVLGWTGPQGAITLRQLLSFTSGMEREAPCTSSVGITLEDCVQSISQMALVAPPGTRFDYGSTHLQVAARMAEVVTGQTWANIFATQLKTPLGLGSPDLVWYTAPRQALGTTNPLIAGGLRATMNEYAKVLALDFNRGVYQGNSLIGGGLFTTQATEPYPNAVIGNSPFASAGLNFHYGLTAWLECPPPATNCAVLSSPGAFGFTPWFDRDGGYYAILGMEVSESQSGIVEFSVSLAQTLKPLIRQAL